MMELIRSVSDEGRSTAQERKQASLMVPVITHRLTSLRARSMSLDASNTADDSPDSEKTPSLIDDLLSVKPDLQSLIMDNIKKRNDGKRKASSNIGSKWKTLQEELELKNKPKTPVCRKDDIGKLSFAQIVKPTVESMKPSFEPVKSPFQPMKNPFGSLNSAFEPPKSSNGSLNSAFELPKAQFEPETDKPSVDLAKSTIDAVRRSLEAMRPTSKTPGDEDGHGDHYTYQMKIGRLVSENQSLLFKLKETEFSMKLLAISNFFFVCLTVLLI